MRPVARLALLLAFPLLSLCLVAQTDDLTIQGMPDRTPQYASNQLLVRFRSTASPQTATQLHARAMAREIRRYTSMPGLQLVQLAPGTDFNQALAAYRNDPSVLYAEPNYIRKPLDNTPNDTYFHDLWNMHNIGQPILLPAQIGNGPTIGTAGADIHALEAWGITTGSSSVVIGLIDTGIDVNHEDLAANVYRNEADCNNNGVDDDGNGYIDDCNGYNALDGNSDLTDIVHHGTHVAGTIGAAGNNGLGVVGVNWNVKILTCKFLGIYGGTDDGAIACINYMATMKDRGANIVATNNSWGGYGYSQALYDAIDSLRQRGVLVIAAAGNSASDNDGLYPLYPASYPLDNIISVAASDYKDAQTYFSSFGVHTVSISAPGDHILSTTPENTYSIFSGTSMATPHVTGVAALLKAQDPTRDWKAIRNLILAGGDVLPKVAPSLTNGRLNAFNSLTCQSRTVSAPLQPQASNVLVSSGKPVNVSVLNINCGLPGGTPAVVVGPTAQQVNLHDDGTAPDQDSNDGIYTGQWTPSHAGLFSLTFPGGQQVQVAADPYSASSASFQYRAFTGTSLKMTDESFAFIPSPFPISFAGGAYDGVVVSDNGYVSLDSYVFGTPAALPYAYANTLIAPFWDSLVPAAGGNVFWTVNGTAPNRELVVEWRNMSHTGCKTDGTETVSFEMVFFEGTTDLLFNYAKTAFAGTCTASDNGATASVGVQATTKTAQQFSFKAANLASNTAMGWKSTLPNNTAPTLKAAFPTFWVTDIFDTFVELLGTNFSYRSVVLVNGVPATTYVFSSTDLFFDLPPSDLTTAGSTLQLSVFNGLPGGGPSQPLAFPIKAADFTLMPSSSLVTVRAGQSASTTIFAYPNPAFHDGVTLTCSNLPSNVSCSIDPGRILTNGFAVVTFTAKPLSSSSLSLSSSLALGFPVVGLLWLGAFPSGMRKISKRASAALCLLAIAGIVGCGAGGGGGTRSSGGSTTTATGGSTTTTTSGTGSYQVTITGTSGSVQHGVTLTLTVTS